MIKALIESVGASLLLAIVLGGGRALFRQGRTLDAISDVVVGTPADDIRGTPAVPSVAVRLVALEKAVSDTTQTNLEARVTGLEAWRDEHLRSCGRPA